MAVLVMLTKVQCILRFFSEEVITKVKYFIGYTVQRVSATEKGWTNLVIHVIYEFYRHDISASHVDPSVKFILEACIAENDADRHITNIKVSYIYKNSTIKHCRYYY